MKNSILSLALRLSALICLLAATGCEVISDSGTPDGVDSGTDGVSSKADSTGENQVSGNFEKQSDIPSHWQWIYGRNIAHWPVTINLSSATVHYNAHKVTVKYDRLQQIPAWNVPGDKNNVTNVNGSIWLIREFEGQWYIGTFEYLRVGQETKEFLTYAPQFQFAPKPGDRIGFMVSTMARAEDGTVSGGQVYRERSNILWMTWGE